jgi:hypothetical protein
MGDTDSHVTHGERRFLQGVEDNPGCGAQDYYGKDGRQQGWVTGI